MTEQLNVCDIHPFEEEGFRRSVLRGLLARQAIWLRTQGLAQSCLGEVELLGDDRARSFLINQCAQRIAVGACTKFTAKRNGLTVEVSAKE